MGGLVSFVRGWESRLVAVHWYQPPAAVPAELQFRYLLNRVLAHHRSLDCGTCVQLH